MDEVSVMVGSRYLATPRSIAEMLNSPQPANPNLPNTTTDRGFVSVNWRAHDENDDQLSYSIYYRGDNETRWKLLKEAASQAIVGQGGTISHQHGVGVDHKPYLEAEKGALGVGAIRHAMQYWDPNAIMNPGKLV